MTIEILNRILLGPIDWYIFWKMKKNVTIIINYSRKRQINCSSADFCSNINIGFKNHTHSSITCLKVPGMILLLMREHFQLTNHFWVWTLCIRKIPVSYEESRKNEFPLSFCSELYTHFTGMLVSGVVYINKSNNGISSWDFAHRNACRRTLRSGYPRWLNPMGSYTKIR